MFKNILIYYFVKFIVMAFLGWHHILNRAAQSSLSKEYVNEQSLENVIFLYELNQIYQQVIIQ